MFLPPAASEAAARIYETEAAADGYVMNATRLWAWRPEVMQGFIDLRRGLREGSTLTPRDFSVMVCAAAAELGDAYCALAFGHRLAGDAGPELAAAVLRDQPHPGLTARDRALAGWARRVVRDPNRTTAADVDALRAAGLGDREIFDATAWIAFRIAFSTVNDALGARPDWQLRDEVPAEVRAAVAFGRPLAEKP
jgi:alkylhydroperoxidase family enzyme